MIRRRSQTTTVVNLCIQISSKQYKQGLSNVSFLAGCYHGLAQCHRLLILAFPEIQYPHTKFLLLGILAPPIFSKKIHNITLGDLPSHHFQRKYTMSAMQWCWRHSHLPHYTKEWFENSCFEVHTWCRPHRAYTCIRIEQVSYNNKLNWAVQPSDWWFCTNFGVSSVSQVTFYLAS